MKRKKSKTGMKRMFAGTIAAMMVLSAGDAGTLGIITAEAGDSVKQWKEADVYDSESSDRDVTVGGSEDTDLNEGETPTEGDEVHTHVYDSNGFCSCDEAYQPANLTTDKYDIDGDGAADEVYEISNAGQLYWFADKVNNENDTYGSVNVVLAEDIVVNENVLNDDGTLNEGTFTEWIMIGTFNGTFDGQNHTISGLYFNQADTSDIGLFRHVGGNGKVSNTGVIDSYFSGTDRIGGVCANNDGGTIANCYNAGVISGQVRADYSMDIGYKNVGGVCGSNSGTITDSYNRGIVSGDDNIGGVCGNNTGTITDSYNAGVVKGIIIEDYNEKYYTSTGGVCGNNTGTIKDSYNTGMVSGCNCVGGVSGLNDSGIIIGCYNTGIVSGLCWVGGLCGENYSGKIIKCYNTGDISGNTSIGGVSGLSWQGDYLITNCNNTGKVSATEHLVGGVSGNCIDGTITNSNNTGMVSGIDYEIGGVSGACVRATITNCYYDSSVYTGEAVGKIGDNGKCENTEGKTPEQYKSGEVTFLLQGDQTGEFWGQTIGTDDYPVLGGTKVYRQAVFKGCVGNPGTAVSCVYSNEEMYDVYSEHTYIDGKCDQCGKYADNVGARLVGYSLSLNGNIGVNFYMELADDIVADKEAYMQITLPNGTVTKVYVSEAQTNTTINEGTTYYRFPCEVAAYEMTQDIKAQMFNSSGKCGSEYTYTVRDYAEYLLSNGSQYVDAIPLIVAMLDYGACAQKFFNVEVDNLANKNSNPFNDIDDIYSEYIDDFSPSKAENDVLGQFVGFSLVLKSETTLNLFYEPAEGIDESALTFYIDGQEITPEKRGRYYVLSLKNIKSNQLGSSKTFTVTDGTNTLSGEYCAMMYCYQVIYAAEGTYSDDLVTLVNALAKYAYCAGKYF